MKEIWFGEFAWYLNRIEFIYFLQLALKIYRGGS
jgi:hypothetical protein